MSCRRLHTDASSLSLDRTGISLLFSLSLSLVSASTFSKSNTMSLSMLRDRCNCAMSHRHSLQVGLYQERPPPTTHAGSAIDVCASKTRPLLCVKKRTALHSLDNVSHCKRSKLSPSSRAPSCSRSSVECVFSATRRDVCYDSARQVVLLNCDDVLSYVAQFLNLSELSVASRVCRHWRNAIPAGPCMGVSFEFPESISLFKVDRSLFKRVFVNSSARASPLLKHVASFRDTQSMLSLDDLTTLFQIMPSLKIADVMILCADPLITGATTTTPLFHEQNSMLWIPDTLRSLHVQLFVSPGEFPCTALEETQNETFHALCSAIGVMINRTQDYGPGLEEFTMVHAGYPMQLCVSPLKYLSSVRRFGFEGHHLLEPHLKQCLHHMPLIEVFDPMAKMSATEWISLLNNAEASLMHLKDIQLCYEAVDKTIIHALLGVPMLQRFHPMSVSQDALTFIPEFRALKEMSLCVSNCDASADTFEDNLCLTTTRCLKPLLQAANKAGPWMDLQELTLHDMRVWMEDLSSLLAVMPVIKTLTFKNCVLPHKFFNMLMRAAPSSLDCIEITDCYRTNSSGVVKRMSNQALTRR